MSFPRNLKRLREAKGLTQVALAKRAGIGRPYLWRLETGRQDPSLSRVRALAKALGVKVAKLIGE